MLDGDASTAAWKREKKRSVRRNRSGSCRNEESGCLASFSGKSKHCRLGGIDFFDLPVVDDCGNICRNSVLTMIIFEFRERTSKRGFPIRMSSRISTAQTFKFIPEVVPVLVHCTCKHYLLSQTSCTCTVPSERQPKSFSLYVLVVRPMTFRYMRCCMQNLDQMQLFI